MLTKDQAAKIIARHAERGIDSAFFLLVDTLTEGEARQTPDAEPRGACPPPWTLDLVKSVTPTGLVAALHFNGLAPLLDDTLDWNMAMGAHTLAFSRKGEAAMNDAWNDIAPATSLLELRAERVARVALWAVVKPK